MRVYFLLLLLCVCVCVCVYVYYVYVCLSQISLRDHTISALKRDLESATTTLTTHTNAHTQTIYSLKADITKVRKEMKIMSEERQQEKQRFKERETELQKV